MNWLIGRTVDSGFRGASFGEERFTDLEFADDAVSFAENMPCLVKSLATLCQESRSLGLLVSWIKTKIQNFLQAVVQVSAVTLCGETVEVFPYLGSQITPDDSSNSHQCPSLPGFGLG